MHDGNLLKKYHGAGATRCNSIDIVQTHNQEKRDAPRRIRHDEAALTDSVGWKQSRSRSPWNNVAGRNGGIHMKVLLIHNQTRAAQLTYILLHTKNPGSVFRYRLHACILHISRRATAALPRGLVNQTTQWHAINIAHGQTPSYNRQS